VVSYSIVQGGWGGDGSKNLDADPLFVDADGPDDIVGTADDDLRLSAGSPAIDSGDTLSAATLLGATDLDGNARLADDPGTANTGVAVLGLTIDRGVYEFVSLVPGGTGACCLPLGDCMIGTEADCLATGGTYNGDGTDCTGATCPAFCLGDMNADGVLDGLDTQRYIAALLSGAVCP
jgi:hypothetical protein